MSVSSADKPLFACAALVGVGLMGGSLGLALRAHGLAAQVVGIDRSPDVLATAQQRGAIDRGSTDLSAGVRDADLIVVAAPVGRIPELLEAAAPHARQDALITDLGSAKGEIVAVGERLFGPRYVGGHPMAGSETGGIGAARADLYAGAAWAVVSTQPFADVYAPALISDSSAARLAALIERLGARPLFLDAARHDAIVALVSHLPHVLSFAFARMVAESASPELARDMAGGSFRDMMRVSNADPSLWQQIFQQNRAALLATIDAQQAQISTLRSLIAHAPEDTDASAWLDTFLRAMPEPDPRPLA